MNPFVKALTLLLLIASVSEAQENPKRGRVRTVSPSDGSTILVRVRVSDEKHHVPTVVTLPGTIHHVVSSWDRKDLSVEHVSGKLFLKLFSRTEGNIDVITSKKAHYRLYLAPISAPGDYDSQVLIRLQTESANKKASRSTRSSIGAIALIRAMRLGKTLPRATVRRGLGKVLLETVGAEYRLQWVYETGRFRGYVLVLRNKSRAKAYHLDITRLGGKRIVLVGSSERIVPPKGQTRVYLVFWR